MNNDDIVLRQRRLLARSRQLRLIFSDQTQALRKHLSWVDQAQSSLVWLRHNPQWPVAAVLVLAVVRSRGAIRWAGRLWWGWQTVTRVRQWLDKNSLRS